MSKNLWSYVNQCLPGFRLLLQLPVRYRGKLSALCFATVSMVPLAAVAADLAELDARCEQAREAKIAPERAKRIEECVTKGEKPDRASCERYFATFGDRSGNRPRLHYDLPECQKAFDARQDTERRSVD